MLSVLPIALKLNATNHGGTSLGNIIAFDSHLLDRIIRISLTNLYDRCPPLAVSHYSLGANVEVVDRYAKKEPF